MNFIRVNSTFDSNECSKKESDTFASTNSTRYELLLKFNLHFFFPNREKTRSIVFTLSKRQSPATSSQQFAKSNVCRFVTQLLATLSLEPPFLPYLHSTPSLAAHGVSSMLPSPPPTASLITNKGFQATCA